MSRNQPSKAEDPREEYPSTGNMWNSTHHSHPISCALPLPVDCWDTTMAPFKHVCLVPLPSMLSRAATPTASGKTKTQDSHKNPASAAVGFACLSAPTFPSSRGGGERRGKDETHEDPCLSLGFKCHILCDLLQECSHSPFSAEPLEHFLFAGVS